MVSDHLGPDVDICLAKQPDDRREALASLRSLSLQAAPQVHEAMRYEMPAYEVPGGMFAIAAQKNYFSL